MPTPADRLPADTTSLARRIADLEREVKELRAARRLESATIGGGGLRITDGGRLAMDTPRDEAGMQQRMVDIGRIDAPGWAHLDGSPQQAIWLRREDGHDVLAIYGHPDAMGYDTQFWGLNDHSGNQLVADDAATRTGLARPYLPVTFWPTFEGGYAYWPRVSTTTMTEMWVTRIYKQHPRIVVGVMATMDTSGAKGEIQVKVNGISQGSPQSVEFGVGTYTIGPIVFDESIRHMDQVDVAVQGRRTSGTGAIRTSLFSAYTLQS
ncbi:hypothetical protein AB0A77_28260 [Streptomyces varsoviensis]|uniref:hypothetical protein n=1 Tax=Streptomyces varsoviensis TaxID=67373 RepID=UPI0033D225D9